MWPPYETSRLASTSALSQRYVRAVPRLMGKIRGGLGRYPSCFVQADSRGARFAENPTATCECGIEGAVLPLRSLPQRGHMFLSFIETGFVGLADGMLDYMEDDVPLSIAQRARNPWATATTRA